MSTPLTRYYSEVGTPPGRWLGSGVEAFGAGQIRPGMQVTEEQLALLVGMGRDPSPESNSAGRIRRTSGSLTGSRSASPRSTRR